ncbi:hypothetical protein HLK59_16325 [Streptomyces sp. S3(2020)]|uniref:hypothetical protein n=1 Tax=Streptomyces sp. S3(2020) TaxID=2732044 RepID=UPI001488A0EA|nr:hypothetical protein [Streptomyces sp. S3(2020)]NNN31902.1 hypothetical protein [Streptomyces sp. S3(2020)]
MFKSGVGFLALFGLGWWLLGSSAFDGLTRQVLVVSGCVVMVGLMLAARRFLPSSAGGPFPVGRRRRFNQINGLQWLLIIAIAAVCRHVGVPVLVPPLIAVVVGLHFLPLAAVFEQPRLRIPAALLIASGAAGMTVWLTNGPDESVRLVVGLISALSLWAMAIWTVAGAASATGQGPGNERSGGA